MKKTLRLKYRLEPVGETGLEFQVLEMDEKFRCKNSKDHWIQFNCSSGIFVTSEQCPEIWLMFNGTIMLRGYDKSKDMIVSKTGFCNSKARDSAIKKIHAALKEWSVKWFKGK